MVFPVFPVPKFAINKNSNMVFENRDIRRDGRFLIIFSATITLMLKSLCYLLSYFNQQKAMAPDRKD